MTRRIVQALVLGCSSMLAGCGPQPVPSGTEPDSSVATATVMPSDAPVSVGPAVCLSEEMGIRLEVPAGWSYSNSVAACQWLDPETFELVGSEPDRRVAIEIRLHDGDVGTTSTILSQDARVIDGKPATVWELESGGGEGGVLPPRTRIYQYVIQLGAVRELGPNLSARTSTLVANYEANREILDDLMRSLQLPGW